MTAGWDAAPTCDAAGDCITCGDVAVPLTVVDVFGPDARCRDAAGREESVATELIGPVFPGQRLLVHAGVAISRLDDDRAAGRAGAEEDR
ncbi:MAG: hydrogenase expression/formation protein HypC [Mycobacteriales bacterium]|jgi:hydrogenase expression/formation protein HypC